MGDGQSRRSVSGDPVNCGEKFLTRGYRTLFPQGRPLDETPLCTTIEALPSANHFSPREVLDATGSEALLLTHQMKLNSMRGDRDEEA